MDKHFLVFLPRLAEAQGSKGHVAKEKWVVFMAEIRIKKSFERLEVTNAPTT